MSGFDQELVEAKAAAIERHLARIEETLPLRPDGLRPRSDASDAVVLHLWQAVQLAIDLAYAACVHLDLPSPTSYAGAFRSLGSAGVLSGELADRLVRAAGFRNVVAHADEEIDLPLVHAAALAGPDDLRALVAALRAVAPPPPGG